MKLLLNLQLKMFVYKLPGRKLLLNLAEVILSDVFHGQLVRDRLVRNSFSFNVAETFCQQVLCLCVFQTKCKNDVEGNEGQVNIPRLVCGDQHPACMGSVSSQCHMPEERSDKQGA